jgi:hypothetical protein
MCKPVCCLGKVRRNEDLTTRKTHRGSSGLCRLVGTEEPTIRMLDSVPRPLTTNVARGKEGTRRDGDYPTLISLLTDCGRDMHDRMVFLNEPLYQASGGKRPRGCYILRKTIVCNRMCLPRVAS